MRAHSRLNETKSNRAKSNRHRRTIIANNCDCYAAVVFFFCFDYCSAEMQCHMKMKMKMKIVMEMEIETNKRMLANSSCIGGSGSGSGGRINNGSTYCSIRAGSNHYRNQQQFHHDFQCNAKRNVAHTHTLTHSHLHKRYQTITNWLLLCWMMIFTLDGQQCGKSPTAKQSQSAAKARGNKFVVGWVRFCGKLLLLLCAFCLIEAHVARISSIPCIINVYMWLFE